MELKKLKPDVIHAHFGPDGYMALPLAKFFKVPLVVTFHGYDATVTGKAVKKSFFMHRVFYQNRKKLFDEASRIIAVSGYIKERVLEMGANPEKVTTHYIGIDIKNFNYFPFEKHDRGILFVGRLTEKKGLKYLIEAYNRLKDDYPYPLTIIGDGPQKEEMQKLAGSNNRIHFLGSMGHDQVIDEIKRAKALCLPSVVASNGDSEGLPIVILEAMALGTPVISTYHSGIPEAITDGSSGFLVEEKNVEGLTQKLNMLTQANDKLVAISKMARQRVENEFSLEIQNRKLEEIYLNEIKSD